jgi:hypothetical protein
MALGRSPRPVFFFFFRGFAAKKEEKRIFFGDCIPQTPALQSGKPLKLTPMGRSPLTLTWVKPVEDTPRYFAVLPQHTTRVNPIEGMQAQLFLTNISAPYHSSITSFLFPPNEFQSMISNE